MLKVSASNPSTKDTTQRVVKINICSRHGLTSAQIKETGNLIQNKVPLPENANDEWLKFLSDEEILLIYLLLISRI